MASGSYPLTVFLVGLITFPATTSTYAATYKEWETITVRDEMWETNYYRISTRSTDALDGWIDTDHISLVYSCKTENFTLYSNNLGFRVEDTEMHGSNTVKWQHARVKVDDGMLRRGQFMIPNETNDKMHLHTISGGKKDLISEMKSGREIMFQITLFNTDGSPQLARFSLMGFTAAMGWCDQKTS